MHVFFIPLAQGVGETACTCGLCGSQFRCESWRYKAMVPASEVPSLTVEELLERTNPALEEKLEWSRRLEEFRADPRFEGALRSLDALRPGPLKRRLRDDLLSWGSLDEGQREDSVRLVDESAHAMEFARSMALRIPSSAGGLFGLLACFAVWTVSLALPAVGGNRLWWGVGVAIAGLLAGAAVYQFVQERRVRRWTHEILIPEGRNSGINFHQFAAILDDLPPPSSRSDNELRQLQEHAQTIRKELSASEMKGSEESPWGADPEAF